MDARPCFIGQEFAQPRDRAGRACILRFDDQDVRDMFFDDPSEAWAAWNQYSRSWNCTLFMAAEFPAPAEQGEE